MRTTALSRTLIVAAMLAAVAAAALILFRGGGGYDISSALLANSAIARSMACWRELP